MPITEERVEFLYECWALYGVGMLILALRFAVRIKTVGFRGMQGDDYFSILVSIFYTVDAFTVHLVYFFGTNVEASVYMGEGKTLSDHDIADFVKGSKLELTAWYAYTALIWSLKGTMLCFFSRMTIGTWHNVFVKSVSVISALGYVAVFFTITFGCFPVSHNYQVIPDPGERCTFKKQNFLVTTVFNVLTDGLILCIPLPLLWKLQVPARKKIVIGLLLSSGAFVIAAAIIRVVLTLSAKPSALTINEWGVRETLVGIITVNIPVLRPLFTRIFWTDGLATKGSSNRTNTIGRSGNISGHYELSSVVNEPTSSKGHRGHSSQESIIAKGDITTGVVVHTTYGITHEQGDGDDDMWYNGRGGHNKASVHAGVDV